MRCSNTDFLLYLRKLSQNLGQFSSTAHFSRPFQIHCSALENLPQFRDNCLKHKKKKLYISFLWCLMRPKIWAYHFKEKNRTCLEGR